MKVAIVYDRVNKWGGAERVLLVLHELFPEAPLYTSVYNKKTAPWAKIFKVKTSFLQQFSKVRSSHELFAPLMPFAFESLDLKKFDLVISVTSEAAKGVMVRSNATHICYCLTPTRYLWSGYNEYFKNPLFRYLTFPIVFVLRLWDRKAASRPDAYIAISKEVQKRIKKYYKKDAVVIYPPLNINGKVYKKERREVKSKNISQQGYFLVVSRLVAYKRVELAIEAANALQLPLKIIGTGAEEKSLQKLAGSSVEFLGNLTDRKLLRYYNECEALIFPGKEDFGLTILEAQSFGKPVIAYKGGGALETVREGRTGEFFYPQTKSALIKTLQKFKSKNYKRNDAIKQAEKFKKSVFKKEFKKAVQIILKQKKL